MLPIPLLPPAHGHGLGFDETPPAIIGDRQVSVEATMSPTYIEAVTDEGARPVLTVRAHDPGSNATIAGMDFRIAVEHSGEVLLDQRFSSPDGLVKINLVPADLEVAEVNGQPASPDRRVEVSNDNPAEVRSRIMLDGGLYHIAATLEKTSAGLQLQADRTFDLYVSVSKTQEFVVEAGGGDGQQSTPMLVKTYYAEVKDFAYENGTITFSMPFDWRQGYVEQVQLVHMEVQFPKAVKELQVNGYRGMINGKELSAETVLIDDYSYEDARVVHFVLNNDKLTSLARTAGGASTMDFALAAAAGSPKFPLDILSSTEKYLWQLSWGPEVIETGVPTTFVMNLQDGQTGELLRGSSFDFVLERKDGGGETYRQRLSSGQGTFSHQYTFGQAGTYRLAAENINGSGEDAQLDIVVLQGSGIGTPQPSGQQQQPSGCLIATAAFGSELAPQVQFLRGFRDGYILKSESGAAFMGAFNSVYYSFSPRVADYEREQPWLQSAVRAGLYPLFGILLASEKASSVAAGAGGGEEAGAIIAGATASTLIGAVYLSPAASVVALARKKQVPSKLLTAGLAAALASLATAAVALAMPGSALLLLSLATSAFVVTSAATAALAVAKIVGKLR